MKTKLTLALAAIFTGTAFGSMPAAMPEFKNAKQLAEWRAEMTAQSVKESSAEQEHAFYTGKPYVESSDSYAFKYRSYNPELARWTSEDPSGFPDGANCLIYVSNQILSNIDPDGLSQKLITFENYSLAIDHTYTWGDWMMNFPNVVAMLFAESSAYNQFKNSVQLQFPVGDQRVVGPKTNDVYHYYPDGMTFYKTSESIEDIIFESIDGEGEIRSTFKAYVISTRVYYYE